MSDLYLDWYCDYNHYNSTTQRDYNALRVAAYFRKKGWTDNAIAGILGNMWVESSINPWLYEGRPTPPPEPPENWVRGFGLTQWTNSGNPPQPPHKLIIWCLDNGYDWRSGWVQCYRIYREQVKELQWIVSSSGLTFTEWSRSTGTPEYLCEVFKNSYERGGIDLETRQQWARTYYDMLQEDPELPDVPPDPAGHIPIWLLFKFRERRSK